MRRGLHGTQNYTRRVASHPLPKISRQKATCTCIYMYMYLHACTCHMYMYMYVHVGDNGCVVLTISPVLWL